MIHDEAVEAAVEAAYVSKFTAGRWKDIPKWKRDGLLYEARAALEAAAPHMLRAGQEQAWEEGVSYALPGTSKGVKEFEGMRKSNPYQKEATK